MWLVRGSLFTVIIIVVAFVFPSGFAHRLFVLSFLSDISAKGAVKEGLSRGPGAHIFTCSPTPWVAGASWLYQGRVPHLPFASELSGGLVTFRGESVCAPTQGTKE